MTNKMTNRTAIAIALEALNGNTVEATKAQEAITKLKALDESLAKKSGTSDKAKKAKSEKDEILKGQIILAMTTTTWQKATQIVYNSEELFKAGVSSQKVTSLLKALVDEGKVEREKNKGSYEYRLTTK